jgi:dTDP-4-dehydrorhamnose reductase
LRVLLTGANGQLGRELQRTAPSSIDLVARGRAQLDITDGTEVERQVTLAEPEVVINAAAYTAVDLAEEHRELTFAVNAEGARNLARAAATHGARMLQVSTDFVFDGVQGRPYQPEDSTNPQTAYGASKRRGEEYVIEASGGSAVILRTAWLYSRFGTNFATAMLRRMQAGQPLRVVADQVGTPTWARGLAEAIWRIVAMPSLQGLHHWTDAGVASWYDFAVAIQEEALLCGLLGRAVEVQPIASTDYPTPAHRPAYSVLDKARTWSALALRPVHWRSALRSMLKELGETENV